MRYPIIIPQQKITLISHKTDKHEITGCNPAYMRYTGLKSLDNLIGLTDYSLPWQEYTEIYHQQEKDCLEGKIYSAIQPCCYHTGDPFIAFNTKLPKVNENKKVTGLTSLTIDISSNYLFKVLQILQKNSMTNIAKQFFITNDFNKVKLTARELECLFYLMRGKTAKLIAKILNISHRTVEMHIDRLKLKFNCQNKSELIQKSIEDGYMEIIPPSLFNENLLSGLKY